jgi:hypothetical protein
MIASLLPALLSSFKSHVRLVDCVGESIRANLRLEFSDVQRRSSEKPETGAELLRIGEPDPKPPGARAEGLFLAHEPEPFGGIVFVGAGVSGSAACDRFPRRRQP